METSVVELERELKTFTFKQVHEELERENSLLLKEHDISDFSNKADFILSIGFKNSKATKMYSAIVESEPYRKEFSSKYFGLYKFILLEQLERVCEKYNLFVRDLGFFAGDIPEKNIKDMMDFKLFISDYLYIDDRLVLGYLLRNIPKLEGTMPEEQIRELTVIGEYQYKDFIRYNDNNKLREIIDKYRDSVYSEILLKSEVSPEKLTLPELETATQKIVDFIDKEVNHYKVSEGSRFGSSRRLETDYRQFIYSSKLSIAAVTSLFNPSAFYEFSGRISKRGEELVSHGQVNLDPIVMVKNKHGYIIITAWGDEANDELIVNQIHN